MKRIALTILVAAMGAAGAIGAPVTKERATATACSYLKAMTGRNYTARQVLTRDGAYYVVNLSPQGWVIVSADDAAEPIVGFNTSGKIDWANQPDAMKSFLSASADGIKYVARTAKKANARWKSVTAKSRAGETIENLVKVNWDQGYPYNQYCPPFDAAATGRVYNGCVAVAMGQAMSVQQWPNQPLGSMTYSHELYGTIKVDYDREDPYNWDYITANANATKNPDKGKEVARLLFHTGVSVRMGYGKDGSGIPSSDAQRIATALKTYFGYPSDVKTVWRNAGYNSATWSQLIYNELDAGRAVVFNAVSSQASGGRDAGHSFNITGYNNGLFYVNWGWGGNSNGYFSLDVMNPPGYAYTQGQVAIIGIGSPARLLRSIELSDMTIEENLPAGTVVGILTINGEAPKPEFAISCTGAYDAVRKEYKTTPFEVKNGYLQTKSTLKVSDYPDGVSEVIVTAVAGSDRLKATFRVNVLAERTVSQATNISFDRATGVFDLHSRHGASYVLKSASGAKVAEGKMNPLPYATFNASLLEKGTNTLVISDNKGQHTLKIVK